MMNMMSHFSPAHLRPAGAAAPPIGSLHTPDPGLSPIKRFLNGVFGGLGNFPEAGGGQ